MSPLLFWFASLLLRAYTAVARPSSLTCPPGTYANGVRPSGATQCVLAPSGTGSEECVAGGACGPWPPQPALDVRVWCSGVEQPRTDGRRVWCADGRRTS